MMDPWMGHEERDWRRPEDERRIISTSKGRTFTIDRASLAIAFNQCVDHNSAYNEAIDDQQAQKSLETGDGNEISKFDNS